MQKNHRGAREEYSNWICRQDTARAWLQISSFYNISEDTLYAE
jgi:hypothetical protein